MWQAGGVGWGGVKEVIKPLNNLNQTERGVF